MEQLSELYQSDDWKTEKHVPVITAPEQVKIHERFDVSVTVGQQIEHPNTTPHHIRWIQLFFLPDGKKIPIEITSVEFAAHGDHSADEDEQGVYTDPTLSARLKIDSPGTLMASAYCNIHGLWQSAKAIACE